ncbi:hypothetical protein I4U23_026095 [Adineta vaga]|nr:hypothetical protein I4U23_026095 [Adineta vaga]
MDMTESEMMVLSNDGYTTCTTLNRKQTSKQSNPRSCNMLRLGIGFVMIAFFSLLGAVTIWKTIPNHQKSVTAALKEDVLDMQKVVLKAMFSTTYLSENENLLVKINNLDDITNQLNTKLNGRKIRITDAFFRNHIISKRDHHMTCENPLSGNVLQMNFVVFYSDQCTSQNCKVQSVEELQNMFKQLAAIPVNIQLNDNRSIDIRMKICGLIEKKEQETVALKRARKVKQYSTPAPIATNFGGYELDKSHLLLKNSMCTQSLGKILLVQMTGEHGSNIQDDLRTGGYASDYQDRQYPAVTLYEGTTYRLHLEFDCGQARNRYPSENNCDLSQNINVWIDFDDDNSYDTENLVSPRTRPTNYISGNSYNVDIRIPTIDGRTIRSGTHRMSIGVIPTDAYLSTCGAGNFQSKREYTVNLVPKATYTGVIHAPPANVIYQDPICSQNTAQISLVLMAGERGTEIRDDLPTNTLLHDYYNRHHLAVTLYENTVYLIRIQLDCAWQLNTELFENGCNLAQDVNLWFDVNDDGRFDQTEIGAPYRWPVTSYMAQGIYDLQIAVPLVDERRLRTGQHRMRIVVTHTDSYRRTCGRNDYNETREYTVNVISRGGYLPTPDEKTPYIPLTDIVCSADLGKIVLVVMAGEHRTQIRDDSVTRTSLTSDNRFRRHDNIVLFEDTVYLLRIQLDCSRLWISNSNGYSCSLVYDVNAWIDLNDDGVFDSSENAAPYHWPLTSYTPQGVYDLQLYIPILDTQKTRRGPHRLQLVVSTNEQYRRKCGNNDYKETREYMVSIVPNSRLPAVDTNIPHLVLSDAVCSQKNSKIALVLMAGEQGTHIRDNIATNAVLRENQNRHHLAVSVYENTIYRIRIQLDCFPHWKGGFPDTDCNVAHDVNVLIDFNNDDRFDESESRIPHRWPLLSSMPLGIYDLDISIPAVDGNIIKSGSHRLRVVVTPSDEYTRKCGRTDYRETREYTITIISKIGHRELQYQYPAPRSDTLIGYKTTYCQPGNLICSNGHNTIGFVHLYGEQGTEIRDDLKQCNSVNNYHDRSSLTATLIDNAVYSLRIQLHCTQQWSDDRNSYDQHSANSATYCSHPQYLGIWIDLNNDGTFDENKERILPKNWYENGQSTTQYDLSIAVPKLNERSQSSEQHRLRIVLVQDERNRKPCYSGGYGEVRDYTVSIIPKSGY